MGQEGSGRPRSFPYLYDGRGSRDEGISGERFADTIARLGFEYVEDKLLNGKVDKAAVMKKKVIGGATC